MALTFVDRESTYPNRYLVTPDNGSAYYALLTRADEPVQPGTPLNADTFNQLIAELKAMIVSAGIPEYTADDYGKVLSCSENGLVWVRASVGGGSSLYKAEEVAF